MQNQLIMETCELTIVATSRNDNHGGDMLQRTTLFIRGLLYQTRKHRLRSELILVEWNPPPDQPLLQEVLPAPGPDDYLSIRYVIVPAQIHQRHDYADRLPLFQMIAKNVGIRRARGRFVLCTNVDLLFSDSLFEQLAGGSLREGTYYRCNRVDVPQAIPYGQPIPHLLDYCRRNVLQRLGKHRTLSPVLETVYWLLMSSIGRIFDWWREPGLVNDARSRRLKMAVIRLDTDACGDFTLMSLQDWLDIEGYAELEAYSIHIDSLAVMTAAALGKQQHVFPPSACTYHVTHEDGWELADPIRKLYKDIERPMLDWSTVRRVGIHLLENQTSLQINQPDWGLAAESLEEFTFAPNKPKE